MGGDQDDSAGEGKISQTIFDLGCQPLLTCKWSGSGLNLL